MINFSCSGKGVIPVANPGRLVGLPLIIQAYDPPRKNPNTFSRSFFSQETSSETT